jgi:hypothetical protein
MMKKLFVIGLVLVFLYSFSLSSCTLAGADLGLLGTWTSEEVTYNEPTGQQCVYKDIFTFTFNQDDSGLLLDAFKQYSSNGSLLLESSTVKAPFRMTRANTAAKTITLTFGGDSVWSGTYNYELDGSALKIKDFNYNTSTKMDLNLKK